jgi:cell division protein FtsL
MTLPSRPTSPTETSPTFGLDQPGYASERIALPRPRFQSRTIHPVASATLSAATAWIIITCTVGCSGQSNFLTGGTTVSQLKTTLSHTEFENDKLKRSVAKLDQENRILEDKLASEQLNNGDLTARLDDARNLLKDRGLDSDRSVLSRNNSNRDSTDDTLSTPRTQPASQSTRKRRKPPVANISGQVEIKPPVEDNDAGQTFTPAARPTADGQASRSGLSARSRFDTDHHSFDDGALHWVPIADGTSAGTIQVR